MSNLQGDSGDDSLVGGDGADVFFLDGGGRDTAAGGAGNDQFVLGAAFGAGDAIDGGDGYDIVFLAGDYGPGPGAGLGSLANVETLVLGTGGHYDLALRDDFVGHGGRLNIAVDDPARMDGSAETDATLHFYCRGAGETLIGGGGDDTFELGDRFTRGDVFVGGEGFDSVTMMYGGLVRLGPESLSGVEALVLVVGGAYHLVTDDANVAAGGLLYVTGVMSADLQFSGAAERDGAFVVTGAAGDDTLTGGRGADSLDGRDGDDVLTGGKGGDSLWGWGGTNSYAYLRIADSRPHAPDIIYDLQSSDRIDLHRIDADVTSAGDQAFILVAALDGHAGQAALRWDDALGDTQLEADVDGDGKADLTILLYGQHTDFTGMVL